MRAFRRTIATESTLDAFRAVLPDYDVMLVTILDAILARFERHGGRYPFIDTKLNLITGEDFGELPDASRDFKGRTAIYSWIQGRGLEALVGHAQWLPECSVLADAEKSDRAGRLARMIATVFDAMERIRAKNDGKLFFTMTPDGDAFDMGADGRRRVIDIRGSRSRFSDLFYAKGMLAAAAFLGRKDKVEEAKRLFRAVLADAEADRFERDAITFDPKNPARTDAAAGQLPQGPRMIALGGCALFAAVAGDDEWFEDGARLLRFLFDHHANLGRFPDLQPGDFFELRDAEGRPWKEDGAVRSDPGHSLEFVGLAAKLLLLHVAHPPLGENPRGEPSGAAASWPAALCRIFMRNFRNGFNPRIGGICKHFDLIARRPLNDDLPWWNLPETMRAAAELLVLAPDAPERADVIDALVRCSNGFMSRFVNPRVHLMAYQMIDANGKPVDVIPATPDADPGYHTGLSLIDMLRALRRLS